MAIGIVVNKCPKGQCTTDRCIQNCLAEMKSKMISVLGSTSFSLIIQTANGQSFTVLCQLCFFGDSSPTIQTTTTTTTSTATVTIGKRAFPER